MASPTITASCYLLLNRNFPIGFVYAMLALPLRDSRSFAPIRTYSHLFAPIRTYSHLFAPIRTYSHLFAPIRTYSR
jgi:hypothetical protein